MHLNTLSLTNFRAFNRLEVEVPRHLLLLVGDNAQGKTSFLEAIHYLTTLDSPLVQSDRQLITFLALKDEIPVSRLVVGFQKKDGSHSMEIRLIIDPGMNGNGRLRKEVLIDGIKRNQNDVFGQIYSVFFIPQMMKILEGGPDERRRFLDSSLSQAYKGYAKNLSEYTQAIIQRNALLKQIGERGSDINQLDYWDNLVSTTGSEIIDARLRSIQEMEVYSSIEYEKLTGGKEKINLTYVPSFYPSSSQGGQFEFDMKTHLKLGNVDLDEIVIGFKERLLQARNEEIARGITTIGPHRDEMRVLGNGIDLGLYGSRGQIRSAITALKLAEMNWLNEKTGEWPVLLLDETLAELDHRRREDLLNTLKDSNQAILTTTDLHLFSPEFTQECKIWHIQSGKIT